LVRISVRLAALSSDEFFTSCIHNILKLTRAFANLAHHGKVIPILPTFESPLGICDPGRVPQIVEAGARATEERLP
jgi:hypothetical protein